MLNRFFISKREFIFLSALVFLSRLPFLSAGFGSEEDAWLMPLTAKHIAFDGYEMSRAPGHPLQEIIYSWFWNAEPFWYNLLSAIASVVAVIFFALALKKINFKNYLFAAFSFAFTPVVFISSTYAMDYMLAMAFLMGSFYFLARNDLWLAGIFLGIAIGFRITSAAMLIPFAIIIGKDFRKIISLLAFTIIVGFICFIPVIRMYGFSFFTFSDQFPYPNIPKVFYKATIGVFGLIGIAAILFYKLKYLFRIRKIIPAIIPKRIFYSSVAAIAIYIIAYLRLPQKSAYLIPIIPFVILLFGYYLREKLFKIFCVLLTLSSFIFSINLTDSFRGANYSQAAFKFKVAGQEIFIDPLSGPIFSDYTKRLNKIEFTEQVFRKIKTEQNKIILICGWWYNELKFRNWSCEQNTNVKPVFYIDKSEMQKYILEGYKIYFLPEQNTYNDQFSQMCFTDSVALPYKIIP